MPKSFALSSYYYGDFETKNQEDCHLICRSMGYKLLNQYIASSPIGTIRSLLPLPITRTTPCCKFMLSSQRY